ncbi:hypothetical protein [Modicisalibacter radicis]|uniref:hypothetical protein n=1 Tax=Halomonas sp. EAR18 TaxID=2518972 RepID=UPI00109CF11B|nr:hypothetical protein [Halomonas sp. EAR18]
MFSSDRLDRGEAISGDFGFYPRLLDVRGDRFEIETLDDHASVVSQVVNSSNVYNGWYYPEAEQQFDIATGSVRDLPYAPRVFGLPKTHMMTVFGDKDKSAIEFAVWSFSFFSGMRMTTTEAGYLDATPVKPGTMVDFVLTQHDLAKAIDLSLAYLDRKRSNPRSLKRVASVIHALFLAQYPRSLPFERFNYLYIALDTCYRIFISEGAKNPARSHASRVQWMCETVGIETPEWAKYDNGSNPELAEVRNNTFHEGLFFDEPLGFSIYGGNNRGVDAPHVELQMEGLVCRLLVAILGASEAEYVRTPIDTRHKFGLDF